MAQRMKVTHREGGMQAEEMALGMQENGSGT